MRTTAIAAWSALGTIVLYVAWIIAAADDYDGGIKHGAAITAGVLCLACLAALVVSLSLLIWRWLDSKR